ncbi:hypothetical protein K490DRAFT_49462 [Saccharata proteae CBS 121410]|uniref:DUF1772-domain-containing protein n=1 Tax=Saccharata proteae CBS 121410 TaxID=1314787 RepID=A0A9P4LS93_9PEZI|nr:hypothetical protein K490DRAFT_49462 [Saccharata proteae CBS 121410]
MSSTNSPINHAVLQSCISFSFILLGNAITQSFMGVPALLVDFPPPSSPAHQSRAQLLGRTWPVFWKVGNNFFRPISTLGALGYMFLTWNAYSSSVSPLPGSTASGVAAGAQRRGDWRIFAIAALCHVVNVVHSAVNMQPLNDKIESCARGEGKEVWGAEGWARSWIRGNYVRIVCPAVAGTLALWNSL